MNPATTKPFAGYVRVSRTNQRSGPSFISPAVQRDAIAKLALANGLEVTEVIEEMDVSGGKSGEERQLGRLVERVEAGELGGLLVWKVSRYSRNLLDGVTIADRVSKAGGRIVGTDLDTGMPMGKAMLGFLLGWAEEELDARRSGWRDAQRRAAERGAWPSNVPFGYSKDADGVLVPNADGPVVTALFTMRAKGASLNELVAYAREHATVPIAHGSVPSFSRASIASMLRGTVYLGKIVNDDIVVEDTHPALTDRQTWDLVQVDRPALRNGSMKGQGILLGLVHCAACGGRMTRGASGPKGKRTVFYTCQGADCTARASAQVALLDALVMPRVQAEVDSGAPRQRLLKMMDELHASEVAVAEAQAEMDAFNEVASVALLGAEAYAEQVTRRREALAKAVADQQAVFAAHDAMSKPLPEGEEHRAIARQLVERVTVGKAVRQNGKPGNCWQPIEERVTIEWRAAS